MIWEGIPHNSTLDPLGKEIYRYWRLVAVSCLACGN